MSSELRLIATGETLEWRRNLLTGTLYLSVEGDDDAWYAYIDDRRFEVYKTAANDDAAAIDDEDDYFSPLFGDDAIANDDEIKRICESVLVEAGIAYVLVVEDDDGAFPSD